MQVIWYLVVPSSSSLAGILAERVGEEIASPHPPPTSLGMRLEKPPGGIALVVFR